ncbi:MAG: PKD domain-containing protein [Candidatus Saccharimonadales bacterium]
MSLWKLKQLLQVSGILMGFAIVAIAAAMVFNLNGSNASANVCSPNDIMHCGTSSASDFISKTKSSNAGTQTDLAAIYAHYGLAPSDYSRFVTSARDGIAYKNGDIKVDGRIVATNATSIGRLANSQGPGYFSKNIGGTIYYGNQNSTVLLTDVPVLVLFNAQGVMQFAVIKDCGNPTTGERVTPTYSCDNLIQKQIDRNTFSFSTKASAGNGATINKVVYDFGDGTTATKTNPTEAVTHKYAKDGTFTAKVTVYVNLPGAQVAVVAPAGDCLKQVIVKPVPPTPVAACTNLTVTGDSRTVFSFQATASADGGAKITGYDFVVSDGSGKNVLQTKRVDTSATSASTSFTVTTPGDYKASVTVLTSIGSKTSGDCQKDFTVKPVPVAACKNLIVTPLDRTTYKLTGTATADNGAAIQSYSFVVKNDKGSVVISSQVASTSTSASANVSVSEPGDYTATLTVQTSEGNKTANACVASFTVPKKPIPPVPSVKIVKDVDGVKQKQVAVGQVFTYNVTVTNDGKVDLKNVVVTDVPPAGVSLLSADKGTISGNTWAYTMSSLKIGEHMTFALTGKVDAYKEGNLVNTACVNAPEVNPEYPKDNDMCDTATVTVTPPAAIPPVTPPAITPAQVLPNTGAGDVVGIFAGAVVVGTLGYRLFLGRKLTRR